jgi:HEAT repeat protein
MRDLQSLIQDLESSSSSIRDRAALELVDLRNESAVGPLLRAISKPENVNHRGTLVYALGAFNCEAFLEVLVDLALTGNFEVAVGAVGIIEESATSAEAIQRVQAQLRQFDLSSLVAEHHKMALQSLLALTPGAAVRRPREA